MTRWPLKVLVSPPVSGTDRLGRETTTAGPAVELPAAVWNETSTDAGGNVVTSWRMRSPASSLAAAVVVEHSIVQHPDGARFRVVGRPVTRGHPSLRSLWARVADLVEVT